MKEAACCGPGTWVPLNSSVGPGSMTEAWPLPRTAASLGHPGPGVSLQLSSLRTSPFSILSGPGESLLSFLRPRGAGHHGRPDPWAMAGTGGSVGAGLVSASSGSQPPNASASHSKVQARGRIQAGPSPGGTETFVSDCTLALPTGKTKEELKGAPWGARTDQRWGHSGRQLVPGVGGGRVGGLRPSHGAQAVCSLSRRTTPMPKRYLAS